MAKKSPRSQKGNRVRCRLPAEAVLYVYSSQKEMCEALNMIEPVFSRTKKKHGGFLSEKLTYALLWLHPQLARYVKPLNKKELENRID